MAAAKAKTVALSVADKCRNILAAGWEAHLNTIKADAKGSKGEIYTSKVHYMIQKGTPYLIVPENHMHNINIIIDERGSLAVSSPIRGRVASLLKSLKKVPPRVAMTGDVLRMKDTKVSVIADSLKKDILKEHRTESEASHGVSAILSSAGATCRSRSEGLLSLLNEENSYSIFKFDIGSCVYIDSSSSSHDIELDNFEPPRAGLLIMLSVDHHGFDVLAKVPQSVISLDVPQQYHWKEFRFTFKEPAKDVEDFCSRLVELEEEAIQSIKSYSGL
ncbi:hypothetical protein PR202_ga26200 [Eleusine coracana subsp. coracana]|uniref:Uncharacterized protein n=1 Tax=Eleusine coracana subsp. coracana TaxID=191504 RepID=A0AAV5DBA4_ELECO|nr:hypothetical protein PR202_ga26200 [Eleusine coracana subsp. coracana]